MFVWESCIASKSKVLWHCFQLCYVIKILCEQVMNSDHPINVVVGNCYKIFLFSEHHFFCCPSPLILGYFFNQRSSFIASFFVLAGRYFSSPPLFVLCCSTALLFAWVCSAAASGQEHINRGLALVTSDSFPQGSSGSLAGSAVIPCASPWGFSLVFGTAWYLEPCPRVAHCCSWCLENICH